jgi:trehalose/maltose transport system substrate-binding protein
VIMRNTPIQPVCLALFPGYEFHRIWGNDSVPELPCDGTPPQRPDGGPVPSYVRFGGTLWLWRAAWRAAATFLLSMLLVSCRKSAQEPVTLRYPHGWRFEPNEISKRAALTQEFTQQTGIQIREMPHPETAFDQLDLDRKLLKPGSSGIDLLGIDLIWSATLGSDLTDLAPYSATEISSIDPQLLPSFTVNEKLVAIPYQVNVGALEYRNDLLRGYGYDHPPRTWDELERMAMRIQSGERAKGRKDFWGYVWQGAAGESLTCNALEWQVTEGGGRIIEHNRTISVNNPAAIRAWERAKHWIGSISPPSVLAYREIDSMNAFGSAKAAFNRVWLGTTITRRGQSPQVYWRNLNPIVETGFTSMPSGPRGSASTLGGSGLAVSRYSAHPSEAIEFVRFLVRAQIQSNENTKNASPERSEIANLPFVSDHTEFQKSIQRGMDLVSRPSVEAGVRYKQVSAAYAAAVHAVLTGQKPAPEAAADLEQQLVQITGFPTGSPKARK